MAKLFDFSLRINGFPIKKAKTKFDKILAIPEEKYENYVIEKRKEIVNFHLQNNAFYQNLVGKNEIENWNELPVLTKKDLQQTLKNRISKGFLKKIYLLIKLRVPVEILLFLQKTKNVMP